MPPEVLLESCEQLAHLQPLVAIHEPRSSQWQRLLLGICEFARHNFPVDGIGDTERSFSRDQAQVSEVHVIMARDVNMIRAGEDRLYGFAHTVLPQDAAEVSEVRDTLEDQLLLGVGNDVAADSVGAAKPYWILKTGSLAQRVHQPWLSMGLRPDLFNRVGLESLAGFLRVLKQQRIQFGSREVAECKCAITDVECAPAGNLVTERTRVDTIVLQVAYATQHDALWEAGGALGVPRAELAQDREKRVADKSINFVDQQYEGTRV